MFDNSLDNKSSSNTFKDSINNRYNYNYDDKVMKSMQTQIPKSDTLNDKSHGKMTDTNGDKFMIRSLGIQLES